MIDVVVVRVVVQSVIVVVVVRLSSTTALRVLRSANDWVQSDGNRIKRGQEAH